MTKQTRTFYLLDSKKKLCYCLTLGSTKNGWVGEAREEVSASFFKKLRQRYLADNPLRPLSEAGKFLLPLINTPVKKLFWEKADLPTKTALIFSYHGYVVENKGILNIEIENWLFNPFFKKVYQQKVSSAKINFKNKWFKWLPSFIAIYGDHCRNLRFENVHLTQDLVNGKLISAVHYDKYWLGASLFFLLKHYWWEVLQLGKTASAN
ncbi:hypothetical protein KKD61_01525 [Patescibacteria group bacterium]|nr:hypothetical protein [Patescibacteria group bacterium]